MKGRAKACDKSLEALLRQAEGKGCAISGGGSRHFKILVPGAGIVITHSTGSDKRAHKNTVARLKRMGVTVA
jgi:hypothetical protein